ncbi:MAG TPA: antA/AntB antirepressor family protein [Candidatus Tectomicrobia bacterium]
MHEIMPYKERTIGGRQILTVNGRDIHRFLGVQKLYAAWVKSQIRRLHLIENEHFIILSLEG